MNKLLFVLVFVLFTSLSGYAQPKIRDASTKERKDSGMKFGILSSEGLGNTQFYSGVGGSFGYQWRLGGVFSVGTHLEAHRLTLTHPKLLEDSKLTIVSPTLALKFNFNPVRYKTIVSPYLTLNPGFAIVSHGLVESKEQDVFGNSILMESYSKFSFMGFSGLGIEFFPGRTINFFAQANINWGHLPHVDPQQNFNSFLGEPEINPFIFYSFTAGLGINLN